MIILSVGLSVSFAAFWLICTISKPPGLGIGTSHHDESMFKPVEEFIADNVSSIEKVGEKDIGDGVLVTEV